MKKTITFGLGKPSLSNAKGEILDTLSSDQTKLLYTTLRQEAILMARLYNRLVSEYYVMLLPYMTSDVKNLVPSRGGGEKAKKDTSYVNTLSMSDQKPVSSSNILNSVRAEAKDAFSKSNFTEIFLKGEKSLPNRRPRKTNPISITNLGVKLVEANGSLYFLLNLFNKEFSKQNNISNWIAFRIKEPRRLPYHEIVREAANGNLNTFSGALSFKDKGRGVGWVGRIVIEFEPKTSMSPISDHYMGIDLGYSAPLYCSIRKGKDTNTPCFQIGDKNNIQTQRSKIQREIKELRKSLSSKSFTLPNEEKIRLKKKLNKLRKRERSFIRSVNHSLSSRVLEDAKRHRVSVIFLEDLSGMNNEGFLGRNWSKYELKSMIQYKAEDVGIDVVLIDPKYTSQICSSCKTLSKNSRYVNRKAFLSGNKPTKSGRWFVCYNCGHEIDADKNASLNISDPGFSKIRDRIVASIQEAVSSSASTEALCCSGVTVPK